MIKKLIKISFIGGCLVFAFSLVVWLATKQIVVSKAEMKAQALVQNAVLNDSPKTDDQKIVAITTEIFQSFQHKDPALVPLLRLRPYLTNKRLPKFLRLPAGVLETHLNTGLCDNAARMLAFTLKQEGYQSVQWNMVTDKGGHSALLVTLPDGREVMADPFYGYVTVDDQKHLIHPNEARELIRSGQSFDDVFSPISDSSDSRFYQNFESISMGAEGEDLIIEATIPLLDTPPFYWGKLMDETKMSNLPL